MIDCGEGAQYAFQRQRLKFSRLEHIFLTHLHGDHVLGLPGLISSLGLGGAGGRMVIHTFKEGEIILRQMLRFFANDLPFHLEFDIIKPEEKVILETSSLTVRTIPLKHRIPTVGYVFEEKPKPRHIDRPMVDFHQVPVHLLNAIRMGDDFVRPDGTVIPNARLTKPATPSLSYAHISDTAYKPELAEKIHGVDLLFHETTYLDAHAHEAAPRGHSTAKQAAMVARDAEVGALLTGHYSSRYKTDDGFLSEARTIFPRVILNREGLTTDVAGVNHLQT